VDTDGSYLKVWDATGESLASVDDAPILAHAVETHVERGIDSLIRLTLASGAVLTVRAATVAGWVVTTPASRARALELERDSREEERTARALLGLPWDED
jgi:hypothetical protein